MRQSVISMDHYHIPVQREVVGEDFPTGKLLTSRKVSKEKKNLSGTVDFLAKDFQSPPRTIKGLTRFLMKNPPPPPPLSVLG